MRICAIGATERFNELKAAFADTFHEFTHQTERPTSPSDFAGFDLVFDLNYDDSPINLQHFVPRNGVCYFLSIVKTTLAANQTHGVSRNDVVGLNLLNGFINRDRWEASTLSNENNVALDVLRLASAKPVELVQDRVGLVSPRVIFMIINEAFYTLQEGTASAADIDTGMKLGTNYPHGPFEWLEKVGIKNVYETLLALLNDTHDERYKICPLLKSKYLHHP